MNTKLNQPDWWLRNIPAKKEAFNKWLGDIDNVSRVWIRNFIRDMKIGEILDVACGTCIEYDGLRDFQIKYRGIDMSSYLVDDARDRGIDCIQGNIEDIPEESNNWELVYARHIIEHLEYYEKAVDELCRVAKDYVVIVHFIPLEKKRDKLSITKREDGMFFENKYHEQKFLEYCLQYGEVRRIDLNDPVMRQTITLIKLI